MIHLTLLVGQLTRTVAGSRIDHRRRHHLQITGCPGLIQEEIDQGTLQAGTHSFVNRETGTCNLDSQIEVNQIILLGQFPVGQSILGQFCLHATHPLYHIIFCANTLRHLIIRDIRNGVQYVLQILGCLIHGSLQRLVGLFDLGNPLLGHFRLSLLALLHQTTDRLRKCIDFRQVLI